MFLNLIELNSPTIHTKFFQHTNCCKLDGLPKHFYAGTNTIFFSSLSSRLSLISCENLWFILLSIPKYKVSIHCTRIKKFMFKDIYNSYLSRTMTNPPSILPFIFSLHLPPLNIHKVVIFFCLNWDSHSSHLMNFDDDFMISFRACY